MSETPKPAMKGKKVKKGTPSEPVAQPEVSRRHESWPHYDTRLAPTLTLAVSGPHVIIAYDGDLTKPAHVSVADLPALRRALDAWEDALLAEAVK